MKKTFHDFYFGMTQAQRAQYVERVGTNIAYAEMVAGGFKLPSLPMALRFARRSGGKTSVDAIVKTYEARHGPVA